MPKSVAIRLNVPLMLSAPAREPLQARHARSLALTDLIEACDPTREDTVPASPVLRAMMGGLEVSSATDIDGRVTAAIAAVNALLPESRPDGTHAEPPEGDFRQMLGETAEGNQGEDGVEEGGHRGSEMIPKPSLL